MSNLSLQHKRNERLIRGIEHAIAADRKAPFSKWELYEIRRAFQDYERLLARLEDVVPPVRNTSYVAFCDVPTP
jgi:hypothetical protein